MIPTREQIAAFFHPYPKAGRWLRAMRDEIDRLQPKVCCGDFAECGNSNCVPKLRHEIDRLTAELKAAHDDDSATTPYSPPFEGDPKDCAFKASDPVREEEIKAWRDWALGDIADPDLYDDCFVLSRAEIDSAVALMRSAGDGKALLRELRAWIIDEKWCAPGIVRKIDEMLAQPAPVDKPAATPDDERRAMIGMARQFRETYYPHSAVMHASGDDGQELLIYTRGEYRNDLVRLIASFGNMTGSAPVEQPAAAVPDHFPDAGKMVPDDTRELVAQLGHFVCMMLKGEANRAEVRDIIAKMRGGA